MLQPHSSTLMLGNRSNPISFGRTGLPKLHHTAGAVKTSTPTRQHQRVGANNTAQQHQSQPVQHPSWTSVALQNSPNWMNFCGSLFACGAVSGTLLDGIHSSVGLQVGPRLAVDRTDASTIRRRVQAAFQPLIATSAFLCQSSLWGFKACLCDCHA